MIITKEFLKAVIPHASNSSLDKFLPYLNEWMPKYGIITKERICHFIAQLAHESGSFVYVKEIASGKAYDTGSLAKRLGNTPEADGDGQKYKGRGLIQITGTANYKEISKDWEIDVFSKPELLETPTYAVRSACWFWWKRGLNKLVDSGATVEKITKIINGGQNGLSERKEFYKRAIESWK